MPELPEVETTVRGINRTARGHTIKSVWTDYNSSFHAGKDNIKNPTYFSQFKRLVIGSIILKSERRAKNILIHLSNGYTILIHMKMTGHLMYGRYEKIRATKEKPEHWRALDEGPLRDPFNQFIHFVITLSEDSHLVLSDMRKFAKVTLIKTSGVPHSKELNHLGPEPLHKTFSAKQFAERLNRKQNGKIKTVLMDQTVVSGIGNIYSDEILWSVSIHPETKVSHLKPKHIESIWKQSRLILEKGIDFNGDSMSDYRTIDGTPGKFHHHHNAYRRTGKPCTKRECKGMILRKVVGGRSAHFCDTHQKILS